MRRSFLAKVMLPLLFIVATFIVAFLFVYLSGSLSVELLGGNRSYDAPSTLPPPALGTPLAPFEQMNPVVIAAINAPQSGYDNNVNARLFNLDTAPIGAYLPRSGNRAFALIEPTPYPTPFPYPTTPPLPDPGIPNNLPTLDPNPMTDDDTGRILPNAYIGGNCAPSGLPVDGVLTQRYHRYHPAIDIGVRSGTPVIATHSGQVIYADWSPVGYGYLVILQSGAFVTYYAHNTSFNVVVGQNVGKGSILAWSGSTGNSTGPHVHYETRLNDLTLDPLTFSSRGYGTC
jgi:murein DD-endopeptidase MepM/ murein hydrolase activator NlpD